MTSKPKPWIAVVLGILVAPLSFLYVGMGRWAIFFFAITFAVSVVDFLHVFSGALAIAPGLAQIAIVIASVVFAYRAAKHAPERRLWYSRWYALVAIGAAFALAAVVLRVFLYEPFRMPSTSMAPTVERGANVIVQKIGYGHFSTFGLRLGHRPVTAPVKRGDIIAFDYPVDPAQTYVKRVVGLPGDHVEYRDKHVIVNGRDSRVRQLDDYLEPDFARSLQRYRHKLDDTEFDTLLDKSRRPLAAEPNDFAFRDRCKYLADGFVCDVPAGNYFVMGDNRDNSLDSRYWGFVRSELIIGKVVKIIR